MVFVIRRLYKIEATLPEGSQGFLTTRRQQSRSILEEDFNDYSKIVGLSVPAPTWGETINIPCLNQWTKLSVFEVKPGVARSMHASIKQKTPKIPWSLSFFEKVILELWDWSKIKKLNKTETSGVTFTPDNN